MNARKIWNRPIYGFISLSILFSIGMSACEKAIPPPPLPPNYSTPEATFESWRRAVIALDLENIVNAYAVQAQPQLRKDITDSAQESVKAMQKETSETTFAVQKVVYEGGRAYLRVERKIKNEVEIEVLTLVKESNGWKLMP